MKLKENKLLRFYIKLVIIIILPLRASSQHFHEAGTILISTNPVKLFCGLINFEFEYVISPELSLQLSSEYLISDYIISTEKHPDFVVRFGPRIHFFYEMHILAQNGHSFLSKPDTDS